MYRYTKKKFHKIDYIRKFENPNWKTVNELIKKSPKSIFGYGLYDESEFYSLGKNWWEAPYFHQIKKDITDTKPLIIIGQGSSGSSAIVDYLKEYRGILKFGSEFRMLKDPGGIIELEALLVGHWTHWNTSVAIKRFMELAKMHARKSRYNFLGESLQIGFNNNEICNRNFIKHTEKFIDDISFLRFPGNWFMDDLGKSNIYILWENIKRNFGYKKEEFFMIHPEREKFVKATQNYLNSIIKEYNLFSSGLNNTKINQSKINFLIFDQAVWPQHSSKALEYFKNGKIIIVHRDPRDVYLSFQGISYFPKEKFRRYVPQDPKTFSQLFKRNREIENNKLKNHESILQINFEDFVIKHSETSNLIKEFIALDDNDHLIPLTFYKKERSLKQIGKWRNCPANQLKAIQIISEMLPEYCYIANI